MGFRIRALGKIETTLACALAASVACGNSDDGGGGGAASGGTGGSTAAAGKGGSAGASITPGKGGSGASGSSGTGGTGAGGSGAGTSNTGGAGNHAGSGGIAGDAGSGGFSDQCISPCLKELLGACRPQDSCTVQTMNSGRSFVECEASSGYRREGNLEPAMGDATLTVTMGGGPCYSATRIDDVWNFYAPDQTLVATADVLAGTGRCPELEGAGAEPVDYPVDLQDPRCAAIMCTDGTCP